MNTTTAAPAENWRGVFFEGPLSDQNHVVDEIPVWFVYVGDEDAEPTDHVYRVHDFQAAEELAKRLSRAHRLELIQDAMPD